MMTKLHLALITAFLIFSSIAAQCGVGPTQNSAAPANPQIMVSEASARASIPNGSVYLTLTNNSNVTDALVGVKTDAAESAELHKTEIDANDVMRMKPVEAIEIPAGGSVALEPGSSHIMLIGIKEQLAAGDKVSLTLSFRNAAPQTVEVEITESLARGDTPQETGQLAPDHADKHMTTDQMDSLTAQEQRYQVVTTLYLLDTAGLHDLDERLNQEGVINASDAGVVNRVNRLLNITAWPDTLRPQAEELQAVLQQYAQALSDDDVEAAKPLATQAHELQHDLSHDVEHWLESGGAEHGGEHMDEAEQQEHK
jgi:copper(I)-binding protein